MSSSVSPAQTPPYVVLYTIVKHVVHESRRQFDKVYYDTHDLKEILTVCSSWRQVSLERLWRKVELTLDGRTNEIHFNPPPWLSECVLPHTETGLVRELKLTVPWSTMVNGTAYEIFDRYIEDIGAFPFANKLVFMANDIPNGSSYPKDIALSNALAFARLLKSVVPAARTIEVLTAIRLVYGNTAVEDLARVVDNDDIDTQANDYKVVANEEIVGVFTKAIYSGVKRAVLDLGLAELNYAHAIALIPQLTTLSFTSGVSPRLNANLAHKSATTLQRLDIGIRNANMLLYSTSGDVVVYPNLQYLKLHSCTRSQPDSHVDVVAASVAPFPTLKSLTVAKAYPFFDDVLFRGNSATLKYVDFPIDFDTITMLCDSKSFTSKRMAMQHVVIDSSYSIGDLTLIPRADMDSFLSNLVNNAQELILKTSIFPEMWISAALNGNGFNNIRYIDTCYNTLSLYKVFGLLRAFPALVRLKGTVRGLGSELEHIEIDDLPDYVAATYCNVGSNFKVWSMSGSYNGYDAETIDYILLLGLACPKLSQVMNSSGSIKDYYSKITKALQSGPYSKYASQLGRFADISC